MSVHLKDYWACLDSVNREPNPHISRTGEIIAHQIVTVAKYRMPGKAVMDSTLSDFPFASFRPVARALTSSIDSFALAHF